MNSKILFVCCTHGDEAIGKYIFDHYSSGKNDNFFWQSLIANPKALKINRRFVDVDLNRVFPGKFNGKYEEKLAYQISSNLPDFDLVIDWHQCNSLIEDIIFTSCLTPYLNKICGYFNIKHIVELDQGNKDYQGLLIFQVKNGIAVEYGKGYEFQNICQRVEKDINNLLQKRVAKETRKYIYRLFGSVNLGFKLELQNFKKLTEEELRVLRIEASDIYPIFVNSYPHIYCILLQKMITK